MVRQQYGQVSAVVRAMLTTRSFEPCLTTSFVVYVGGIPLLILGGMFWSRRKLNVIHRASNMPGITSSSVGTIFSGSSVLKDIAKEILLMTSRHFKPQYYFWTAIMMGRNLLVIVLIRTVPSDRKCSVC